MNTNQQLETQTATDLPGICRRHRLIPAPGQTPTLPQIIEALQEKLRVHQIHRPGALSSYSADHVEWKQIADALIEELASLQKLQSRPSPSSPAAQSPQSPPLSLPSHSPHSATQSAIGIPHSAIHLSPQPAEPPSIQQNQPADNPRTTHGEAASNSQEPADHPPQTHREPADAPAQPTPNSQPNAAFSHPSHPSHSSHPSHPTTQSEIPNMKSEISSHSTPQPADAPSQPKPNSRPDAAPKHGPVGSLFKLPPATQQQILDLLDRYSIRMARERIAQPEPDGLGISVSEDILSRFLRHHKLRRQKDLHAELISKARKLLAAADPQNDSHLTAAALRLLKAQLFELTASDSRAMSRLKDLHLILNRIRLTDLAERRVHLAEKRSVST
jgi:hypothetical protein